MLTIRLTRKGKKNQPFFRVVVIDKRRTASGGRAVEDLGYVDPLTKKKNFKKDRILYWISKGAQPSPSIHNLLVSEKIIDAKKVKISNISKKKQKEIADASASAKATADKAATPPAVAEGSGVAKEVKPVEEVKPVAASPEGQASLAPEGREAPKEIPPAA